MEFSYRSQLLLIEVGENDAGLQHIFADKHLTKVWEIFTLLTNAIFVFLRLRKTGRISP